LKFSKGSNDSLPQRGLRSFLAFFAFSALVDVVHYISVGFKVIAVATELSFHEVATLFERWVFPIVKLVGVVHLAGSSVGMVAA
jgi:hypothetical protein